MGAEPSGLDGLTIVLAGIVIVSIFILGIWAMKKRESQTLRSGRDRGGNVQRNGDWGGDADGGD